MEIYIYALIFASLLFILLGIFGFGSERSGKYKLPVNEIEVKKANMHQILTNMFPFTRKLLERLGTYQKLRLKLEGAHVNLSPIEFFNIKIILIFVLLIVSIFSFGKFEPMAIAVSLAAGYLLPEIWVALKIKKRKEEIVRRLPETVDLLSLCVEAGLDFTMAVKWVVEKVTLNPMLEELRFLLEEIKWGKSRSQALRDMSRRINVPEVTSFAQTLIQADRMGTPVGEAFMILSEDTRLRRFQRGERIALKAPIKILIPLIFCILPVIAIIIGGPILIQFSNNKLF
ncbi:MAG: type II secretion system F family protein [Candidatus Omnitrophota bacterium]|jgi:tight adherence protein C|nr:MAG: type II secretion system F family protein [Candidatus Omnitrophota bacterium]